MAEEKGPQFPLSQEQRERIASWIRGKWKNAVCPHCLENSWTVSEYVILLRASPPASLGGLHLGGPGFPTALVICKNCGHTTMLNAIIADLGIVPKEGGADASK